MRAILLFLWLSLPFYAAPLRPLALKGDFYPSSSLELKQMISKFFSQLSPKSSRKKPVLLIVAHDRFFKSGAIAALAYQQLIGHTYEYIILLGPYHQGLFPGVAVWGKGNWQAAPRGTIAVQQTVAQRLIKQLGALNHSQALHLNEHSLETQLPFLQQVLPQVPIVPILISHNSYCQALASAIVAEIRGKDVLVIISTDMSHAHPLAEAQLIDHHTLALIAAGDAAALAEAFERCEIELCGMAPMLTGLMIAKDLGWAQPEILGYDTNASVTQNENSVVGYLAGVVTKKISHHKD